VPEQNATGRGEDGLSLIELMITALILGVLLAIAIPSYVGLTSGARKTGAEATLVTAVHDESNYIVANGSGNYATAAQAATLDGGINWLPTVVASASTKSVGVSTPATGQVLLDTLSPEGTYYWASITAGKVTYATATTSATPATFTLTTLP
jgi:type IV pilus assembly protein PilA